MTDLLFVPPHEVARIRAGSSSSYLRTMVLATIFRLNTLSMIMEAGSGHVGTSFSSLDIMTWLFSEELSRVNEPGGDIFFSSKGHDVPALYAVLLGLGKLPWDQAHTLRRLGGLPGHPDVGTPSIVTNSGSLGMGISKARGMALADRFSGEKRRIVVLCGDGELQEGQFWESLQPTANGRFSEITVVIDHNKIQSDTWVVDTSDLGDLENKLASFGWDVLRCDGHDADGLAAAFSHFSCVPEKPHVLIADTVKGKGVSFMEGKHGIDGDGLYAFHAGAPGVEAYEAAVAELMAEIRSVCNMAAILPCSVERVPLASPQPIRSSTPAQSLVQAYSDELVALGRECPDLVVLDADLAKDTGVLPFKKAYPHRFVECGIAEQDMVSVAGGLALSGKLPVVHSFSCFLSTRPNEQIYTNASERTKIVYAGFLSGLVPAGPGHSHQSVRDVSALGAMPGLTILQPSCEQEARAALRFAVTENDGSTFLRMSSVSCRISFSLPENYQLTKGQGVVVDGRTGGAEVVLITYGPVMLTEACRAAQALRPDFSVSVMNFPWLNTVDEEWFFEALQGSSYVFMIDDHYAMHGLGMLLGSVLTRSGAPDVLFESRGLTTIPACGRTDEVLAYHGLDARSLAQWVEERVVV